MGRKRTRDVFDQPAAGDVGGAFDELAGDGGKEGGRIDFCGGEEGFAESLFLCCFVGRRPRYRVPVAQPAPVYDLLD